MEFAKFELDESNRIKIKNEYPWLFRRALLFSIATKNDVKLDSQCDAHNKKKKKNKF